MNTRRFPRKILLIGFAFLIAIIASLTTQPPAQAATGTDSNLESSVRQALIAHLGYTPAAPILVSNVKIVNDQAFGSVVVSLSANQEGAPEGYLFLARRTVPGWQTFIQFTPEFNAQLRQSSTELIGGARQLLTLQPQGDGSAQLSLPWGTGETWALTGGPHSNDGSGNHPWSALDFAGGTGHIRAASDGIAWLDCANFIRIDHAGGWQTGYYHVANIQVQNGQSVSRGQYLGDTSTQANCGGIAYGAHVHFTLRQNGYKQEIAGRDVGGWTIQTASSEYNGCAVRLHDSLTRCADAGAGPNSWLYNDGSIGSNSLVPTFTPTPTPANPCLIPDNMGSMTFTSTYELTASCKTRRFSISVSPGGSIMFDAQNRDSSGWQYRLELRDGGGSLLQTAQSSSDSRAILQRVVPAGNYTIDVIPVSAQAPPIGLAVWTGYNVLSFSWMQSAYCDVTHWRYYLTSGGQYYIAGRRIAGNLENGVRVYGPGGNQIGSGSTSSGWVNVQINDNSVGWFDVYLDLTGGTCGSYSMGLVNGVAGGSAPTRTPTPTSTAFVADLSVQNGRMARYIELGQKAKITFDVINPSAMSINTTMAVVGSASVALPPEFGSTGLISVTFDQPSQNVPLAPGTNNHFSAAIQPYYNWNYPAMSFCSDQFSNSGVFDWLVQYLIDKEVGHLVGDAEDYYTLLRNLGDADQMLNDQKYLRTHLDFSVNPRALFTQTRDGTSMTLTVTVPQGYQNEFVAGVLLQISSIPLADAAGLVPPGPWQVAAELAAVQPLIWGCNLVETSNNVDNQNVVIQPSAKRTSSLPTTVLSPYYDAVTAAFGDLGAALHARDQLIAIAASKSQIQQAAKTVLDKLDGTRAALDRLNQAFQLDASGLNYAPMHAMVGSVKTTLDKIQADQATLLNGLDESQPTRTPTPLPSHAQDTIGMFRPSNHTFYLRNTNSAGPADIITSVGDANSYPVVGDWDGDGYDTVGVFNQALGVFFLYDSNTQGAVASRAFVFGNPHDVPISGRWVTALQNDPIGRLGRAHDGVGVFRPSNGLIYLISAWPQPPNVNVYADYTIVLGNPGWQGLAGKWNGGLLDTAAVYDPAQPRFYMTNMSCNGLPPSANTFCLQYSDNDTYFGALLDKPFTGDFGGLGQDGLGVFSNSTGLVSLKDVFPTGSKTRSLLDTAFPYGAPGDIPLAGHWLPVSLGSPGSAATQPSILFNTATPLPPTPTATPTSSGKGGLFD